MKRVWPYLVLLFLSGEIHHTYSWDSTAAKYLPLQVGNVWVYSSGYSSMFGSGTSFERYRITGTQLFNDKLYYILDHSHIQISGNYNCSSRLFSGDHAIRIDSASMNLYKHASCGASSEGLVDSIASGFGDSSLTCFNLIGSKTVMNDTSDYYIFGNYFNAKKFTTININGGNDQTYLKGIGIARYYFSVSNEICNHILKGCIINGVVYGDTSMIIGINQISTEIPEKFELYQNYPNPFNPSTKLKFQIPLSRGVDAVGGRGVLTLLKIYNTLGHEVEVLVNQSLQPGTYEVDWDAAAYPSGVYYYKLESGMFVISKKMILIK